MGSSRSSLDAYLKQWQQIARRVKPQIAAAIEAQQQISDTMQRSIAVVIDNQERWNQAIRTIQSSIPDMSAFTAHMAEVNRSLAPAFEQLRKSLENLPPRTREALLVLARHGWYIDMDMPMSDLWALEQALVDGDGDEAEGQLCEYFESRLTDIEASVSEAFPERGAIIAAAFDAHRRGAYVLSVPVLIAQADGICKETTDRYLFMKWGKRPQTAQYVDEFTADSLTNALLSPLSENLPISMSQGERDAGFTGLNRHQVLHGERLDYGTRTNSLKAVSLVNYVATILRGDSWVNT